MLLTPSTRSRAITALTGTPLILERLAAPFPSDHPAWDVRIPDRFTPREHVAHLADWERIFYDRLSLTCGSVAPRLPNPDPEGLAMTNSYAASDPHERARAFAEARKETLGFLSGIEEADWDRIGIHPAHGKLTLESQFIHIMAHDGYHLEFLAKHLR